MPTCNTYHLSWVFLPWAWGISSQLLQQSAAAAPHLGYLLTAAPPDLEHGIAPLGPLAHSHHSLDMGLLLLPAAPGLRHGAAPPGRCPWPRVGVAPLGRCP